MRVIADLHIHSRFSRAVSPQMTIEGIAGWAKKKEIDLVATGDWTHPMWMREITEKLEEDGSGLLHLKHALIGNENLDASSVESSNSTSTTTVKSSEAAQNFVSSRRESNLQPATRNPQPRFLLSTEISCIFSQGGKGRRVHTLVWVPTISAAQKINKELTKQGCNLLSDGRPIIGLSLIQLAEVILNAEPNALIVPAHIWTPWFSVFGKMGGFESLEEAFGPYAKDIHAVETGLSSSPDMNWRIKELDSRSIVSFSDAHSGAKLGREVTVFEFEPSAISHQLSDKNNKKIQPFSYKMLYDALALNSLKAEGRKLKAEIAYTIEFYPEEGKYHYTGHRACNIRLNPDETVAKGTTCPVCGKPLTQGVMQRVEEIASRQQSSAFSFQKEIKWIRSEEIKSRPPFVMLVPLQEIIAEAIGSPVASKKTQAHYETLTNHFNGEFSILLDADLKEITQISTAEIADGIKKVRRGDIVIDPGYDGVFGVVKIWKSTEEKALIDASREQLSFV
jgi:PHP family Zn ribbon phosphoesterase